MSYRPWICASLMASCLWGGCVKQASPPAPHVLTAADVQARLEKEGMRRRRARGLLRARFTGLAGLLPGADIDFVAETPAQIFLSVRSFFEQPLYTFATDGAIATVWDNTSGGAPLFYRGAIDGDALGVLLGFSIWPADAVALLLGIAPAAGAEVLQVVPSKNGDAYEVTFREPAGDLSVVTAARSDDALLSWERFSWAGERKFHVAYRDFQELAGIRFAQELEVTLPDRALQLDFQELSLNGPPEDPALFTLVPPAGYPVYPLPGTVQEREPTN